MAMCLSVSSQELGDKRVRAQDFPLTVSIPVEWEVFTSNPDDPNEVLFLQTADDARYPATVSFSAHPVGGSWENVVGRQTYHLLVFEGVPLMVDEALQLRGARGHKWVFKDRGPDGEEKVYYRLYLLLPAGVDGRRLLLMQGSAPSEVSPEFIPFLNEMARSMAWGLSVE